MHRDSIMSLYPSFRDTVRRFTRSSLGSALGSDDLGEMEKSNATSTQKEPAPSSWLVRCELLLQQTDWCHQGLFDVTDCVFKLWWVFRVNCDQDKMQDCWLSDCYFIALKCSAVLAMTLWFRGKYKESAGADWTLQTYDLLIKYTLFNHISVETDLSYIHALLYRWSTTSSALMMFEFQISCFIPVIEALYGHLSNCFNVILHSG